MWGWRRDEVLRVISVGKNYDRAKLRPQGARIGWVNADDLYLDPDAAYRAVCSLSNDLTVSLPTLKRRLRDESMLATTGKAVGRTTLTVQKTFDRRPSPNGRKGRGVRQDVLHLKIATLEGEVELEEIDDGQQGEGKQTARNA